MPTARDRWPTMEALAEAIYASAKARKLVVLTPDTASLVAGALRRSGAKPTRDEIATMICRSRKCGETRCYNCTGLANVIVEAYGESWERPTANRIADRR